MKLQRNIADALACLLALSACTPISPSVHKSSLRPPDSLQPPSKSEETRAAVPIEVRWMNSEDSLNAALAGSASSLVVRLSSASIERLRSDGVLAIDLPADASAKSLEKARILLRVQLASDDLEHALAAETWSFDWDEANPRSLQLRSFYGKKASESQVLPEALVSVHVVLQGEPATTASP